MANVSVDASEFGAYADRLVNEAARIAPETRSSIVKGSTNIKNQMIREMRGSRHFKGFAQISFDMTEGTGFVESEIGPHSGPGNPGAGANIAYFGTSRGGGTVPDPRGALDAERPALEKYMGDLLEERF